MAGRDAVVLALVGSLLVLGMGCEEKNARRSADRPSRREETLEEAMDLGLKLLIDGRFNAFAERFIPPHEKANIEEFAEELANDEDEAAEMIDLFRHLQGKVPTMSEDGSTAAFDLKGGGFGWMELRPLEFEKIDGLWYMR